jgi:hypothetical protein
MKTGRNSPFFWPVLILATLVISSCALFSIPSGEGFNPSDDGVVLAQSWRLMNGEIPHQDFISIRPAGSGYMHIIDYLLPGPLQWTSRWFVIIEYIIYSILVTLILLHTWFKELSPKRQRVIFLVIALPVFLLNINHYNLYAWTTIDALFWFSMALFSWFRYKATEARARHRWLFLAVFSAVVSMLCRQTFLLPASVLLILIVRYLWTKHSVADTLYAGAGLAPGLLYLGMLALSGSLPEFIRQMTGRTELWETGFAAFADHFWRSPVILLFIPAVLSGLVKTWLSETGRKKDTINIILITQKYITIVGVIVISFLLFLVPGQLFNWSFGLFWMLVLAVWLVYLELGGTGKGYGLAGWILLLAWTSAISLGDNAPVFVSGWLAGTAVLFLIRNDTAKIPLMDRRGIRWSGIGIAVLMLCLWVPVQRNNNYRDLPAGQLTGDGGKIYADLEHIRLNPEVFAYLSEIRRIFEESGSPRGRFVIWPNNALVYRFLDSPDPFPLDWMQAAEFAGSEERLLREVRQITTERDLVILVEKYNVKWIAREKIPVDWESEDYPYLRILGESGIETGMKSDWFRIFRTK